MVFIRWSFLGLLTAGAAFAGLTEGLPPENQAPLSLAPRADRAAFMQQHFASVMNVHDAVIRGDLKTAHTEAQAVADRPAPPGLPEAAGPYLAAMQLSASRAAADDDLEEVAAFTASMLATCGDCHRAVGTMPALAPPGSSAVGGLVGHMLAHKAAVDLLAQGLTMPSTSAWNDGVRQLRSAPLRRAEMPKDAKLTRDILENEKYVHSLAERGLEASDTRSRIYVYSELLQSCASCHALHGNVWGPTKR
jgi:cytochrome c553